MISSVTTPGSAAIGQTATFAVLASLNANAGSQPQGSLVYTWQMTEDGGANWRNCQSADGSGQFTNSFTTAPITQTMYDDSTGSPATLKRSACTAASWQTARQEHECIQRICSLSCAKRPKSRQVRAHPLRRVRRQAHHLLRVRLRGRLRPCTREQVPSCCLAVALPAMQPDRK